MSSIHANIVMDSDIKKSEYNLLLDNWNLWGHLPHDNDWSVNSYINLGSIKSVEQTIALCEILPDKLIKNSMLFIMKNNIKPTWEDDMNKNGGCFSFKVMNKIVCDIWKKMFYLLIGNNLSTNIKFNKSINGLTISPKKNFCIIKIWMENCENQDPNIINVNLIKGLNLTGCMFKKHIAEN
jgi:hypothetical protein